MVENLGGLIFSSLFTNQPASGIKTKTNKQIKMFSSSRPHQTKLQKEKENKEEMTIADGGTLAALSGTSGSEGHGGRKRLLHFERIFISKFKSAYLFSSRRQRERERERVEVGTVYRRL